MNSERAGIDVGAEQSLDTDKAPLATTIQHEPRQTDDDYATQSSARVALTLASVFMSMFLVALDRTIVSTV